MNHDLLEKGTALFQYIRELNKLKQKSILNTKNYKFFHAISDLPDDEAYISVHYRDRVSSDPAIPESNEEDDILLSVRKPEFEEAPALPCKLAEWVEGDWENFHGSYSVKEFILREYAVHPQFTPVYKEEAQNDTVGSDSTEDTELPAAEDTENLTVDAACEVQPLAEGRADSDLAVESDTQDLSISNEVCTSEILSDDDENSEDKIVTKECTLSDTLASDTPLAEYTTDIPTEEEEENIYKEFFTDEMSRVDSLTVWSASWEAWRDHQLVLERIRNLFMDLYQVCVDLQRDSETMELIVANGFVRDTENPQIDHPVITRRVGIDYDPDVNCVNIHDLEVSSELYSVIFQDMQDVNLAALNSIREKLLEEDYHPLDRLELPLFLKALIHQLSSKSVFAEGDIPVGWTKRNRLLMYTRPCFFLRNRLDGTVKAIESIIENIAETEYLPEPIIDIISGGQIEVPEDMEEETLADRLAAVGGESVDILLSKEANKEQLEIARRIEQYNAVLVQGPPGTGKTHTIANLMGHFLAQGKSVLVTSQTTKALDVLKEKLVPDLQNLCVSILDDSNTDMEKSIDGITAYMSQTTSYEEKHRMDDLAVTRNDVIQSLADVRMKMFQTIQRECENIVLNGESISPSKAASWLWEHKEDLSYIPGKVHLYEPLPLSFKDLSDLYHSNENITVEEERELSYDIPDPDTLMTPAEFAEQITCLRMAEAMITEIRNRKNWTVDYRSSLGETRISGGFGSFELKRPTQEALQALQEYCESFEAIEGWILDCTASGMMGSTYQQKWTALADKIQETKDYADALVTEQFGNEVEIRGSLDRSVLEEVLPELKNIFEQRGKIPKLTLVLNKNYANVLDVVRINGHELCSAQECDIVFHYIKLSYLRRECGRFWDNLFAGKGEPEFAKLDPREPEQIAAKRVAAIRRYVGWYQKEYKVLEKYLNQIGASAQTLFRFSELDSDLVRTEKILMTVKDNIPYICQIGLNLLQAEKVNQTLYRAAKFLTVDNRISSRTCKALYDAIQHKNADEYSDAYEALEAFYAKYDYQSRRQALLEDLTSYAPGWAEAIRSRQGVHGLSVLPADIEDAWKWKQYAGILEEITKVPFEEYQKEAIRLSKEYHEVTAEYAASSAWYHLLKNTEADIDMKQALHGWKQTVKRIGKGTGKNASIYRKKARDLMAKCQKAVPAWIMPIGKALDNLDPKQNRFDIIIIDEASQSDISSMAILYMGKKLIIVGDDKQVSPMAVGVEVDQINALKAMYLADKIPNAHLYDAKSSVYEVAATTFQPLMLREHFRCVPEIIGFSNMLSYDYKIKPLRDASSSALLPAVVNYRVEGGMREGKKTNEAEARAIVALIRACMEQPAYEGKSFGVISMLGDDQAKMIQRRIFEEIDPKEFTRRRMLCGNASNFQGDERDIVFLSLVDSNEGNGPLRIQNFGADDAFRKRYNVAASRARDQLWVVHSLDPANDLKKGDIRKTLIDYASNPAAYEFEETHVLAQAESPFEVMVASSLEKQGYHLVQQWKVGAYRLDMVAVCDGHRAAIECDGEMYHSGEAKIREDMERQTILERLGWRFIRIRGSEYFSDPENTMKRVTDELAAMGIYPEADEALPEEENRSSELLERVKMRAWQMLRGEEEAPEDANEILEDIRDAEDTLQIVDEEMPAKQQDPMEEAMEDVSLQPNDTLSADPSDGLTPSEYSEDIHENETAESLSPSDLTDDSSMNQPASTENLSVESDPVIAYLESANVMYFDERAEGGSLWIIGGKEAIPVVKKCWDLGVAFTLRKEGILGMESWQSK